MDVPHPCVFLYGITHVREQIIVRRALKIKLCECCESGFHFWQPLVVPFVGKSSDLTLKGFLTLGARGLHLI